MQHELNIQSGLTAFPTPTVLSVLLNDGQFLGVSMTDKDGNANTYFTIRLPNSL